MTSFLRLLFVSLAAVVPLAAPAQAHPLAPSLLEIRESHDGFLAMRWKTPLVGMLNAELRPIVPESCRRSGEPTIHVEEPAIIAEWRVVCAAPLVGSELGVAGIGESRADVLLRVELADGRMLSTVLTPDRPAFRVPARPSRLEVLRSYCALGVEHILFGADHLLFVLGLLLLIPRLKPLAWTLTAFTLGHSITLSAASLGFLGLRQSIAEVAIAASILVLAVELARPAVDRPSSLRRWPWATAALFGLLHGLGFAGALREIGLPAGEITLALFSFNTGIEAGQLAFVVSAIAVRTAVARLPWRPSSALRLVPAYAIGSVAAFWIFERLAAI